MGQARHGVENIEIFNRDFVCGPLRCFPNNFPERWLSSAKFTRRAKWVRRKRIGIRCAVGYSGRIDIVDCVCLLRIGTLKRQHSK